MSNTNCACPSGEGSLRWPCPTHPPTTAAQANTQALPNGLKYELRIPVLSSGHLTLATWNTLHERGFIQRFGPVATYDEGAFVFIGEDVEYMQAFDALPLDLQALMLWAEKHDYTWVRLDASSGDIVDGLNDYSHEHA